MSVLSRIALALVIIGALNWGLIGFFEFDLVASIFGGQTSAFARVVYALVGLSGIACILFAQEDEESSTSTSNGNSQNYRNLSYETEFAEEEEIIVADPQTNASSDNSTTNSPTNYYKKTSKKKKR